MTGRSRGAPGAGRAVFGPCSASSGLLSALRAERPEQQTGCAGGSCCAWRPIPSGRPADERWPGGWGPARHGAADAAVVGVVACSSCRWRRWRTACSPWLALSCLGVATGCGRLVNVATAAWERRRGPPPDGALARRLLRTGCSSAASARGWPATAAPTRCTSCRSSPRPRCCWRWCSRPTARCPSEGPAARRGGLPRVLLLLGLLVVASFLTEEAVQRLARCALGAGCGARRG